MELLHTLFFFVIAIGLLVSFHELGHFWVARKVGVKVLRFSIGFGKVLWSYQSKAADTEYVLSLIPLGGYVKMLDEREGEVNPKELAFAFNRQSLWARSAVVLAGPVFNLLLAIVLFWAILVIGEIGMRPVVGPPDSNSLAASAGFSEGDEILSVNGQSAPTWTEALNIIAEAALDGDSAIGVVVKTADHQEIQHVLTVKENVAQNPDAFFKHLGLKPWSPVLKPIIGKLIPDSVAMKAGLQEQDLLLSADGIPLKDWMQWVNYVQDHANVAIALIIERDGVQRPLSLTPQAESQDGGKTVGKIGAGVFIPTDVMNYMRVEYTLPVMPALLAAFQRTWHYSKATLSVMGKMLIGKASVENLSGPISIAQYAGQSADMGLVQFLKFLALVSVSLGVMNLLPIPVLDGGHLLFYLVEGIKGSPVSEKAQLLFQQVGMALLMSLMFLAMFLDVQRLFDKF